jgi:RecJ-like exonuclease
MAFPHRLTASGDYCYACKGLGTFGRSQDPCRRCKGTGKGITWRFEDADGDARRESATCPGLSLHQGPVYARFYFNGAAIYDWEINLACSPRLEDFGYIVPVGRQQAVIAAIRAYGAAVKARMRAAQQGL